MCKTEVQFSPLLPEIARASTSLKSSHKVFSFHTLSGHKVLLLNFNIFRTRACFSQSFMYQLLHLSKPSCFSKSLMYQLSDLFLVTRSCFSTLTSSNPPRSHSFGLKVQQTTSFGPLFTKFFTSFSQILQMSQHILFLCNPRLLTEVLDLSQFLITLFDFAKFMKTPAST